MKKSQKWKKNKLKKASLDQEVKWKKFMKKSKINKITKTKTKSMNLMKEIKPKNILNKF